MKLSTRTDGRPSMQFYPHDWRTDDGLRLCSLKAKGLWIDLLCIMFDSPRRGYLLKPNGKQMMPPEIARAVGAEEQAVVQGLAELGEQEVYSRLEDGTIYCRRMARATSLSEKRAAAGRQGGRPKQKKSKPKARRRKQNESKQKQTAEVEVEVEEEVQQGTDSTALTDFESFWKTYPKKVGKKAARKAWDKATDRPDLADILTALDKQKQTPDWSKDNGQFIPHPTTWLNQGRWADEVPDPGGREARRESARKQQAAEQNAKLAATQAEMRAAKAAVAEALDGLNDHELAELKARAVASAENEFIRREYAKGDPRVNRVLRRAMAKLAGEPAERSE